MSSRRGEMPDTIFSKYSLNVDGERWVILTNLGASYWRVQLWGPEPMQVTFWSPTAEEAKDEALAIVLPVLTTNRPGIHIPSRPDWRVLLSGTPGRRYRFQRDTFQQASR